MGLLIASVGLHVDSPVVALVLGGITLFAVRRWGRPVVWALMALTILYMALIPAFFIYAGPWLPHFQGDHGVAKASWGIRLDIWRFTARKIAEHPWRGWGVDASRVWDEIPLHPHNAALQLWFELGVVGAAIGAVFWAYVWARIGRFADENALSAGVFAAVAVAYLSIGGMSFGVWQEWWLALGALAVVVCRLFFVAMADWPGEHELEALQPLG
jgi:O-antigen ligase